MKKTHPHYYQNIQHSYLVTYNEMMEIMQREYNTEGIEYHWSEFFFETDFRTDG